MAENCYCEKCNRTMAAEQFYTSNNLEKYPDGKFKQCKKCMTMHVDNWKPDTYLWILQEADVPYIAEEWNKLMMKYCKDRSKVTGMTVIGRYLGKMKLTQWRDYRWKDSEFLRELANKRIEETMKQQGYDAQQITMAIDRASFVLPEGELTEPAPPPVPKDGPPPPELYLTPPPALDQPQDDYFAEMCGAPVDDFNDDLTEEDKTYLRLKWGKTYKPEEWVRLEQLYEEMMASYDIQGAGHIDTLKLVCKTSLKANQLIDIGDIEGFQKMSKVYDQLMKSGKFTAAQNKAESGEFVDSIGELIEMCEKQGYIERYYVESPKDRVDLTIADMQRYTRTLIEEETNLPLMVEKALREIDKEDKDNAANSETDIIDDLDLSLEDLEATLQDKDFSEFEEFLEGESAADADFLRGGN